MTPSSILITQCLQNDFVQPLNKFDPLPNSLHIGYKEALRLVGETAHEGPVNTLMEWAYQTPQEKLSIIHIRDWHDPNDPKQKDHLLQFGNHCIKNTKGAEFIFSDKINASRQGEIVNASGLNDFIDTDLIKFLQPYEGKSMRVGIVGVWTEAKIGFLAYELSTRYPKFQIAICSALTASSSTSMHFIALDHLKNILGLKIFESIGDFTNFLNGTIPEFHQRLNSRIDTSHFVFDKDTLKDSDKRLISYLFRDAKKAEFKVLDGGFSGNVVLKAKAWDLFDHQQVPTVIKIGRRDLVSKERTAFERIEEILGNTAPRIVDFAEDTERGAIKYRYAAMLDEQVTSFQKFYDSTEDLSTVFDVLDTVFLKQLGRLYKAGKYEKLNLLHYYDFSSKYADSVRKKVEALIGTKAEGEKVKLGESEIFNICNFYEKDLDSLDEYQSNYHYVSYVHGDLNGANIIIDAQKNVWMIDFFHTHQGHILKDLIKIENDLLFIFTKINSEEEFKEGKKFIDLILSVTDLSVPPDEEEKVVFKFPQFNKALKTIRKLRSYYIDLINLDKDPYQYHVAMLRYSMHTLSFEECNDYQKKLALYTGSKCCEKVKRFLQNSRKLRIDFLSSPEKKVKGEGLIGMTILPGRKDRNRSLTEDIETIKEENIQNVICLLSENEFEEYGVSKLKEEYKKAGLNVCYKQILDQTVPTETMMNETLKWLDKELLENKKTLIHCVGGIGRTGTVVACYLKKYSGLTTTEAIEVVRKSRSPRAVENELQEKFVEEYR
jgi:protein-tyrosine phosphatase/nicotinamidase-related amidase